MMKKMMAGIIFCSIVLISLPAFAAEQWSNCTVDLVGVSSTSGNCYIKLTWVSGGESWEGSRAFSVRPGYVNQVMAVALTAQSLDQKVLVKLLDVTAGSIIDIIYVRSDI